MLSFHVMKMSKIAITATSSKPKVISRDLVLKVGSFDKNPRLSSEGSSTTVYAQFMKKIHHFRGVPFNLLILALPITSFDFFPVHNNYLFPFSEVLL